MATPHRIDTHTHILPPDYAAAQTQKRRRRWAADSGLERGPRTRVDGSTFRTHLDRVGVDARRAFRRHRRSAAMARSVNEYAADVAKRNPGDSVSSPP
jgi:hypothetical protein